MINDTELDRELQDIVNHNADCAKMARESAPEKKIKKRVNDWAFSVGLLGGATAIAAIGSIAMAYGEVKAGFCLLAVAFLLCGVDDRLHRR